MKKEERKKTGREIIWRNNGQKFKFIKNFKPINPKGLTHPKHKKP